MCLADTPKNVTLMRINVGPTNSGTLTLPYCPGFPYSYNDMLVLNRSILFTHVEKIYEAINIQLSSPNSHLLQYTIKYYKTSASFFINQIVNADYPVIP